jgi:hypothetical protein
MFSWCCKNMLNVYKLGLLENVMPLSEKVTYLFSVAPYLLLVGHTYQRLVHRVVGSLYCRYVFRHTQNIFLTRSERN